VHPRPGEAILVPAKELPRAKTRLGAWLTASERRELALAMLADVLRATVAWPDRFVVTADAVLAETAAGLGCLPLADPGDGLNAALRAGTAHAAHAGATSLLVLLSDVPLVAEEDVAGLLSLRAAVVVARSPDGGTTALVRRPPGVIDPFFGPRSATLHTEAARRAGLPVRVVAPPSLSLDVDRLPELQRLAMAPLRRESIAVARRLLGSLAG
jgi:2-phospho-L-lactate/phosphoenolpyruvate guanylyltransferase